MAIMQEGVGMDGVVTLKDAVFDSPAFVFTVTVYEPREALEETEKLPVNWPAEIEHDADEKRLDGVADNVHSVPT